MRMNTFIEKLKPYGLTSSLSEIDVRRRCPLKLDWNESTIPPSPKVLRALKEAVGKKAHLEWYADLQAYELREKIRKMFGLSNASMVLLTNGSDDALALILRTLVNPTDRVLVPEPSYSHFVVFAKSLTDQVEQWVWPDAFNTPLKLLAEKVGNAKLVYLNNPNNPTGTLISSEDIQWICSQFPETYFIIDEAYRDFARVSVASQIEKHPNLIVTRSFSKSYGLAGLRLGYVLAQEPVIYTLAKLHNFKSLNRLALVAAKAALEDREYMEAYVDEVDRAKTYLYQALKDRGIPSHPSFGNFILTEPPDVKKFMSLLKYENVHVRDRSSIPGVPDTVRISVGTADQMKECIRRYDHAQTIHHLDPRSTFLSPFVNMAFHLKWTYHPKYYRLLKELREREQLSMQEFQEYQNRRLIDHIRFIYANNTFYRSQWDAHGVNMHDLQKSSDIARLPIMVKDRLRVADKDGSWFTEGFDQKDLEKGDTTGSTGSPFTVYSEKIAVLEKQLVAQRGYRWWGYQFGDRQIHLWRLKKAEGIEKLLIRWNIMKRLDVLDVNDPWGSTFGDAKIHKINAILQEFRPKFIRSYVSALWTLSQFALDNKVILPQVKGIVAMAEALPEPVAETIRKAFNAKIFNLYGSTEMPWIAMTCPESDLLHVMSDYYYVEVLREDGTPANPGETGQLVITDMVVKAAPLIRYRIGDLAELAASPCPCGRPFLSLKSVCGRTNDIFTLPNGERVISHLWHIYFRDQAAIKQFQIIQEAVDRIHVKYVRREGVKPEDEERLLQPLKDKLHRLFHHVEFTWERVDFLPSSVGGKFQAVKSFVPNDFNAVNKATL